MDSRQGFSSPVPYGLQAVCTKNTFICVEDGRAAFDDLHEGTTAGGRFLRRAASAPPLPTEPASWLYGNAQQHADGANDEHALFAVKEVVDADIEEDATTTVAGSVCSDAADLSGDSPNISDDERETSLSHYSGRPRISSTTSTSTARSSTEDPVTPASSLMDNAIRFDVTLRLAVIGGLGWELQRGGDDEFLFIKQVFDNGAINAWNKQCSDDSHGPSPTRGKLLTYGDRIVCVNGKTDIEGMLRECEEKALVKFSVARIPVEPELNYDVPVPPVPILPSAGSANHPHACGGACKYVRKARGCKDGSACTHCHLCVWRHTAGPRRNSRWAGRMYDNVNRCSGGPKRS